MIEYYVSKHQIDEAEKLVTKMREEGMPPDDMTYVPLAGVYAYDEDKLEALLKQMDLERVHLDKVSLHNPNTAQLGY